MKAGEKIGKYIAIYAEKEDSCEGCAFINDLEACSKFVCRTDDNKPLIFVEITCEN
jgi:hypothetical protein